MTKLAQLFTQYGIKDPAAMLTEVCKIGGAAGNICMEFYDRAATDTSVLQTEMKADDSPVTAADKASSKYIEASLNTLTPGITVVSEENDADPDPSEPYWTIDPLDGTSLFKNRTGGFAVNIALMLDRTPVLGAVRCPAFGITYSGYLEGGAYKQLDHGPVHKLTTRKGPERGQLAAYFDMAHAKPETYDIARNLLQTRMVQLPDPDTSRTLPHNLEVAEGKFDLHVKTGKDETFRACSGRSWDNAADYRILTEAGGEMVYLVQGGTHDNPDLKVHARPVSFDDVRGKMPAYMAVGDRVWAQSVFPELKQQSPF